MKKHMKNLSLCDVRNFGRQVNRFMYQVSNPKAMEHEPRALFLCSVMKKCISSADYIHPACAQTSCCIFLATARILAREKRGSGLG